MTAAEREAVQHPDCNVCAGLVRDEEIRRGERCAQCTASFNDIGNYRHPEHPNYCNGCGSVQHTRGTHPGRYGAGRNDA